MSTNSFCTRNNGFVDITYGTRYDMERNSTLESGNKKQLTRFIIIFLLNTLGILPIIYLIFFQKKEVEITTKTTPKVAKTAKKK